VAPSPALEPGEPPAADVPAGAASAEADDRPSAGEPAATDRRPPVE